MYVRSTEKHNQIEQCQHMKNTTFELSICFIQPRFTEQRKLAEITKILPTSIKADHACQCQQLSHVGISHRGFSHRSICFITVGFPTALNSTGYMQYTYAILNKL